MRRGFPGLLSHDITPLATPVIIMVISMAAKVKFFVRIYVCVCFKDCNLKLQKYMNIVRLSV